MAPQCVRRKGSKRYVTWATARKQGAAAHPEQWEAYPGTFIAIRAGAGSLMDAADATAAYKEGDVVIAASDVAWVDSAFRPLSSLRLVIPTGWTAADVADARGLRTELMKLDDRLERYEIWRDFVNGVKEMYAAAAAKTTFPKGAIVIVSIRLQLEYEVQMRWSSEWKKRITDEKTIVRAIKIAKTMTLDQVRDQAFEEWQKEHYNADSPHEPVYHEVSATVATGPVTLGDQPMASLNWLYHSIPDEIEHPAPGTCVIDYLMTEIGINGRNPHFRKFTRAALVAKLGEQPTSNQVMELVRSLKTVSAYAVSPCMDVYDYVAAEGKPYATIMFINNNGHCYPITDEHQRHNIAHKKQINLGELALTQDDCAAVYPTDLTLTTKDEQTNIINLKPILAWLDAVPDTARTAIVTMNCVAGLCAALINRDRVMAELFQVKNGSMTAFKHPTRDLTVIAGDGYHARKALCDKYFAANHDSSFIWRNQSWGVIGMAIMESCYATVPKAYYSADLLKVFEHSPLRAYIAWPGDTKMTGWEAAIDQRRSYTGTLINATQPWYLGQNFDHIRPFTPGTAITPGEYMISRDLRMGRGTIRLVAGWYPHQLIAYALQHGYLTEADISHFLPASTCLTAGFFKKFAADMNRDYPDYKGLVNAMVGCLGILYSKHERCGVTASVEMACAVLSDAKMRPNTDANVMCPALDDGAETYFINVTESTIRNSGHMPLYRQVIAQSYINLDRQVRAVCTEETVILGYNTDCIKIRGPYNEAAVKEKHECAPGEYHRENKPIKPYGPRPSELPERGPFTFTERGSVTTLPETELVAHVMAGGSAVVTGIAGSGKTELARIVVELLGDNVKYIGTAVSNKACENLKERGLDKSSVRTLTALLVNQFSGQLEIDQLKKVDLVIGDECSTIPPDVMGALVRAKAAYGLQVLLLGDPNQTVAVTPAPVDYMQNPVFMAFAGNVHVVCEYKGFEFPEKARYTPALYHALDHFLRTGTIAEVMRKPELPPCWRHLTLTNAARNKANSICLIRWAEERGAALTSIGKLYVAVGLELMVYNDTDRKNSLFKTNTMTVTAIDTAQKTITLSGEHPITMEWTTACKLLDYAFSATVHKYQGGKISEPFTIHEASKMDRETLYTAMSRATRLEDVNIADNEDWNRVYEPREYPICTTLRAALSERKLGQIYRITCADGTSYIGLTGNPLEVRHAQHIAFPTSDVMEHHLSLGESTIELLLHFTYSRDGTAHAIETEWIAREIAARGADNVLNGRQLPAAERAKAPPKKRTTTVKTITPCDNFAKSRYEVRWRAKFIPAEHQVKRFSYAKQAKSAALAAAEAWIAELLKLYA